MKRFIALLFIILLCETSWAAKYPELGACTGNNVRVRQTPGTDGKIIGRIEDSRNQFVILGEEYDDNQNLWYMIDLPTKKGTAYISARYANYGWYFGNDRTIPTGDAFVRVRLTFGIYPEKARALLGRPLKSASDSLEYPGCKLWYNEDSLHRVEISKRGYTLAGVQIGDSCDKLIALGMPEYYSDDHEGWTYTNSETGEEFFFQFNSSNDGEIIIDWMSWECPVAAG